MKKLNDIFSDIKNHIDLNIDISLSYSEQLSEIFDKSILISNYIKKLDDKPDDTADLITHGIKSAILDLATDSALLPSCKIYPPIFKAYYDLVDFITTLATIDDADTLLDAAEKFNDNFIKYRKQSLDVLNECYYESIREDE